MIKKNNYQLIPIVLGLIIYAGTFQHSFHFDDIHAILQKPWIRGLNQIPNFITSWGSRPLLLLSFNLNYAWSGFNVWSWHFVNIGIHLLNIFLLCKMLEAMRAGRLVILFSALVFAVHPLNTEAVTYISSRSSLLATTFFLLGILAIKRPWLIAACFLAGLMVKQIIFTLPLMAIIYHWHFISKKSFKNFSVDAAPYAILACAVAIVAIVYLPGLFPHGQIKYSVLVYAMTQPAVILFYYFQKMISPWGLSIDINFPVTTSVVKFAINFFILFGIYPAIIFVIGRRFPVVGFGLVWMLIAFLPTSSVIPLLDLVAEHHAYLPMIGFSMVTGTGLTWLWRRAGKAVIVYLATLCVLTILRNEDWRTEETIWRDVAQKYPALIRPLNNYGEALDQQGRYDEALAQFQKAVSIEPNYIQALSNIGNIYGKKNEIDKAAIYFRRALDINPNHPSANYNLALVYQRKGFPDEALRLYDKAIAVNPYFNEAWVNKIVLLAAMGKKEEAENARREYSRLIPKIKH